MNTLSRHLQLITTIHRRLRRTVGNTSIMSISDEEAMINNSGAGPSTPSAAAPGSTDTPDLPAGMSKNAMKKAARQARMREKRPEKRALERSNRKERNAALKEGYAAGTLSAADKEMYEKRKALQSARKRDTGISKKDWNGGVIVDLAFDDLMTDAEIASMASQIGFLYSHNRTSLRPFSTVLHTSFGPTASPRLWNVMAARGGWDRWTRSYFREQPLEEVVKSMQSVDSNSTDSVPGLTEVEESKGERPNVEGKQDEAMKALQGPILPNKISPATHNLVYLSADSEEELTTLSENEVYIIGGIVDRNRHKMLCQNKAVELGIRTARLPIGTYLASLPTRKVLTVNQVFEILAQFLAKNDWAAAFEAVIPSRKFEAVGKRTLKRRLRAESAISRGVASDKEDEAPATREAEEAAPAPADDEENWMASDQKA